MGRHHLQGIEDLKQGELKAVTIEDQNILVYRLTDGFYATSSKCTHLFKSLHNGSVIDDQRIRCPLHRAEFNIRNGEVETWACFPPGVQLLNAVRPEKSLSCYPIEEDDGQYFVSLTD